jgi:hypothetical protein
MPAWLEILLLVLVLLGAALFAGGMLANRRRRSASEGHLRSQLDEVNRQLALAHAQDKGWERSTLEAAAREAWDGAPVEELTLIQVIDRPGTDEDHAVFRVHAGGRDAELTLGRREGAWVREG